jgi:hypothetical protein
VPLKLQIGALGGTAFEPRLQGLGCRVITGQAGEASLVPNAYSNLRPGLAPGQSDSAPVQMVIAALRRARQLVGAATCDAALVELGVRRPKASRDERRSATSRTRRSVAAIRNEVRRRDVASLLRGREMGDTNTHRPLPQLRTQLSRLAPGVERVGR